MSQSRTDVWIPLSLTILGLFLAQPQPACGQDALPALLNDTGWSSAWIYTDVERAASEAARTGKPLLALFRCVPCQCAADLDKKLARPDPELERLLRQFVCLRVVQMNGVDLSRFQFDRDLSLAVLFMNADGAVYGRYGTRASPSRTENTHISLPSFKRAAERALELHAHYPQNRSQLAAKRGPETPPVTPEALPHLRPFPGPQAVQNCIHCHMVGEAQLKALSLQGKLTVSDLWCYPLAENLGLRIELDDGLRIQSVRPESPAAAIGLQPGDALVALGGQPLISQADIQWVLHHAPAEVKLPVQFQRQGRVLEQTFDLLGDWKRSDMPWRESLTGLRFGLFLQTLSQGERARRGLPPDQMALHVRYAFHEAAQAGLRSGDVIVAANGRRDLLTESEFLAYLHLSRPPPSQVKLDLVRRGARMEVTLALK